MSDTVLGTPDESNPGPDAGSDDQALRRELELRLQIQAEILEISNSIIRSSGALFTLEDAFSAVIRLCQNALHNDTTTISLYDRDNDELVGVARDDAPYDPAGYFRLPLSEPSLSGLAFSEGRTVCIDDVVNDPRVSQRIRQLFEARSGIAAPLIVENRVIGVLLSMTNKAQRSFTERDAALMEGLARQAALALHTQMLRRGQIDAELRFQRLVELSPVPIMLLERDGRIIEINRAAKLLLRPNGVQQNGRTLYDYVEAESAAEIMGALDEARLETPVNVVITLPRPDGGAVTVEIDANLFTLSGEPVIQVFMKDVSEAREMVNRMSYLATHDALTGLINRREFEVRLNQAIASARKNDTEHTLCYIDLDKFKIVNDSCGHHAGDELLRQVTALLKSRVRDRDSLARLGGDEFGLLLQNCRQANAMEIAEAIIKLLGEFRFHWEEKIFTIGASIGVTPIDAGSGSLESVLKDADTACYVAKERGRNRAHAARHDDAELARRQEEMEQLQEITLALKEGRFQLCQQRCEPLGAARQPLWHCEILLRMVSRSGRLIMPDEFIPAAERYQLMAEIDRWCIEAVFATLQGIAARQPLPNICSINISGQSLTQQGFAAFAAGLARRYQIEPARICFEIREMTAIANLAHARRFIEELKQLGFRFALDNFGDSLSSFSCINKLPVDYLKLDRSLISGITQNPVSQAMVEAINKISHLIGIETIAECVEDEATLQALRAIGVDFVQGHHIARPLPVTPPEQMPEQTPD